MEKEIGKAVNEIIQTTQGQYNNHFLNTKSELIDVGRMNTVGMMSRNKRTDLQNAMLESLGNFHNLKPNRTCSVRTLNIVSDKKYCLAVSGENHECLINIILLHLSQAGYLHENQILFNESEINRRYGLVN